MLQRCGQAMGAVLASSALRVRTACAGAVENKFLRSYAECLADVNGAVHRTQFADRVGADSLDAPGTERSLLVSLEMCEISTDAMLASCNRQCK